MGSFKNHELLSLVMSEEQKNNEWDSLWQEYSKSLEKLENSFEQIQTASNDMQSKFNDVWEKAYS